MISLLLALTLAVPPTDQQWNGLNRAISTAYTTAMAVGATVDRPTRLHFGGNAPPTATCITASIKLTPEEAKAFGLADTITGPYLYGKMTACATPNASAADKHKWVVELAETVSDTFVAGAVVPAVVIALEGDVEATFACACNPGIGTCNWTPRLRNGTLGPSVPAPKGTTLPAGQWSGAACVRKTCVELYGFSSFPPECPLQ